MEKISKGLRSKQMDALSSGGLHQTGKDAVGFEPGFGSGSEADFAEDHQIPESLLRVIVHRRYAGVPEKGEEESLIEQRPMCYGGFEKDRMALKYICPVRAYELTCKGNDECGHTMKSERIGLEIDRRIFTPGSRSSYAWEREYKKRTAKDIANSSF